MRRLPAVVVLLLPTAAWSHEAGQQAAPSWVFDPWVLVPLLLSGLLYTLGTTRLWQRAADWWRAGMRAVGAEMRMGPELYPSFRRAGLPPPTLRCRTLLAGAADAPVWWLADLVRAVLPVLQAAGIATTEEIDIDTLEGRLHAELLATDAVMVLPPVTAAWTRLPN